LYADVRRTVTVVDTSSIRVCATYPTVAMGKVRLSLSLLGHHSSNRTVIVGHLTVATEGYRPLVQRCIVVVYIAT
jgi:hypothetical protein